MASAFGLSFGEKNAVLNGRKENQEHRQLRVRREGEGIAVANYFCRRGAALQSVRYCEQSPKALGAIDGRIPETGQVVTQK